ncbi:MAG: hypothetical protein KAW12_12945, partial [Candidatus Aminicenantes bacterium]|nr:hypothetical protein [Candidatus Aminicenantes bacterium]
APIKCGATIKKSKISITHEKKYQDYCKDKRTYDGTGREILYIVYIIEGHGSQVKLLIRA